MALPLAVPRRLIMIAVGAAAAGAVLYMRNKVREREAQGRAPAEPPSSSGSTSDAPSASPAKDGAPGSMRELALFLAGESWYDEIGWQGIWEREGIESAEGWLRTVGKDVLIAERKKLASHPALLAGCRRRWIVVCRYAGIDVSDAASLWNATEAVAA